MTTTSSLNTRPNGLSRLWSAGGLKLTVREIHFHWHLLTLSSELAFVQVIHYQKQLQQNYIQMYRRNRDLERVMRELSLELENRDLEDYEVRSGSNDIHFEEITATEI